MLNVLEYLKYFKVNQWSSSFLFYALMVQSNIPQQNQYLELTLFAPSPAALEGFYGCTMYKMQ